MRIFVSLALAVSCHAAIGAVDRDLHSNRGAYQLSIISCSMGGMDVFLSLDWDEAPWVPSFVGTWGFWCCVSECFYYLLGCTWVTTAGNFGSYGAFSLRRVFLFGYGSRLTTSMVDTIISAEIDELKTPITVKSWWGKNAWICDGL